MNWFNWYSITDNSSTTLVTIPLQFTFLHNNLLCLRRQPQQSPTATDISLFQNIIVQQYMNYADAIGDPQECCYCLTKQLGMKKKQGNNDIIVGTSHGTHTKPWQQRNGATIRSGNNAGDQTSSGKKVLCVL